MYTCNTDVPKLPRKFTPPGGPPPIPGGGRSPPQEHYSYTGAAPRPPRRSQAPPPPHPPITHHCHPQTGTRPSPPLQHRQPPQDDSPTAGSGGLSSAAPATRGHLRSSDGQACTSCGTCGGRSWTVPADGGLRRRAVSCSACGGPASLRTVRLRPVSLLIWSAVASGGESTMFAQVGWPRRQPRAQPVLANGAGSHWDPAPLWDSTDTELSPPPKR